MGKWDIDDAAAPGAPSLGYDHLAELPPGWLDEAEDVLEGAQQFINVETRPVAPAAPRQAQSQQEPTPLAEAKPKEEASASVVWYTKLDLPDNIEMIQEFSNGQWAVTDNKDKRHAMSARALVESLLHELSSQKTKTYREPPREAPKLAARPISRPAPRQRLPVEESVSDGEQELLDTLGEIMNGWEKRKDGKR